MTPLELRTIHQDPPFQASKWLQVQVLLDLDELGALFDHLGAFFMYRLGGVLELDDGLISRDSFLSIAADYLHSLKQGKVLPRQKTLSTFTAAMTTDPSALYAVKVAGNKQIIRLRRPVVQMQEHVFDFSLEDKKFRSMVLGRESVTFGWQFSYPQLFTDPNQGALCHTLKDEGFPNTALFRSLQRWVRRETVPVPFIVEGQVANVSFRLGKKCFSWINGHPQFSRKGLQIDVSRHG